jgi:hypothetical protein
MPGTSVRVMRFQYAQGARQLVVAGSGQSDDRGQYRIWGLNPGEYYVAAFPPNNQDTFGGRGVAAAGAARGTVGGPGFAAPGANGRGPAPAASSDDVPVAYAPTYYPGVASAAEARPVSVGLGAEVSELDFGVLLVRTARVEGRVTDPDGFPAWSGNVTLLPETSQGVRVMGPNVGSRINWDGRFSLANVPPGRYTLRARSGQDDIPRFASEPITVGGDMLDVRVVLEPGATITGTVTIEATTSLPPAITEFRAGTSAIEPDGGNINARADRDGRFAIGGVPAGAHRLRGQAPRGWMLKSATIGGRDVLDEPVSIGGGETLSDVRLVFSDRLTEINGTVTDARGTAITEWTVAAFSEDPAFWRLQSRHIMTARPDQNGRFQIRGLPPGDYYLAATDPSEPGEWFDPSFLERHRSSAVRVRLSEGQVRTQDIRLQ